MTTTHYQEQLTKSTQRFRAATPERVQGQDGVWLPVIVVPSTFIFCVVMFFLLRVS